MHLIIHTSLQYFLFNLLFSSFMLTGLNASNSPRDETGYNPNTSLRIWYGNPNLTIQELTAQIIPALKEDRILAEQFEKSADVPEGYTIEQHTQRVLDRYQDNHSAFSLPSGINPKDFILFLALHDIGKKLAHERMAKGLSTPLNCKAWELKISRRMFESTASGLMPIDESIMALSSLLDGDIIGDFLKNAHGAEVTFILAIRSAARTCLTPEEFLNLHIRFHQLDAGSYPGLYSIFRQNHDTASIFPSLEYAEGTQNKIDEVRAIFTQYAAGESLATSLSLATSEDQISALSTFFFGLRHQLFQNPSRFRPVVSKIIWKPFNCPATDTSRCEYHYQQLAVEMNGKYEPYFHGANSNIVFGLFRTGLLLMPTGMLARAGIVCAGSGEKSGARLLNMVSDQHVCMSTREDIDRSLRHASLTPLTDDASEFAKNFFSPRVISPTCTLNPPVDSILYVLTTKGDACADTTPTQEIPAGYLNGTQGNRYVNSTPEENFYWDLVYRFGSSKLTCFREEFQLPRNLRLLRSSSVFSKYQEKLATLLETAKRDFALIQELKSRSYFYKVKKFDRREEITQYENWLLDLITALEGDDHGFLASLQALNEKPFPLMFETKMPCQNFCSNDFPNERAFLGPLSLGDVTCVYAPLTEHHKLENLLAASKELYGKAPTVADIEELGKLTLNHRTT